MSVDNQVKPDESLISIEDKAERKFKQIFHQMSHDLGSPLMALSIVAENCQTISDKERSLIKGAAARIKEIAANVSSQYKKDSSFALKDRPMALSQAGISENLELDKEFKVDTIYLKPKDSIIILDDDTSVHSAWDLKFESILKQAPDITIKHFELSTDALDFIANLNVADKENTVFLSDYELIDQKTDGLQVIGQAHIKRSILVTSHYANQSIRNEAAKTKTKIIPKQSVFDVDLKIQ